MRFLLDDAMVDINVRDMLGCGYTPLHFAVFCENIETVRYLHTDCNANVNIRDRYRYTPLHYAVRLGYPEIEEYRYLLTDDERYC